MWKTCDSVGKLDNHATNCTKADSMPTFLVTGGAGFIGSNLTRELLAQGHSVRVLDDLATGFKENLDGLGPNFDFLEASILDDHAVRAAMSGVDYCLHLAALGSVPRSINNPLASNAANVEGSMRVFLAARDAGVKRVVMSSSSSVYGDNTVFPTTEDLPLAPISPYAVSKMAAERYAEVFSSLYDIDIVRLRYFNVFGPRQNPNSEYSAVIPKFIRALQSGKRPVIHGDGLQSRDFTYVDNVIQANIRACVPEESVAGVYNIALGGTVSVLEIAETLCDLLGAPKDFDFVEARQGDIPKSCASIARAQQVFGYAPEVSLEEGLKRTAQWYQSRDTVVS